MDSEKEKSNPENGLNHDQPPHPDDAPPEDSKVTSPKQRDDDDNDDALKQAGKVEANTNTSNDDKSDADTTKEELEAFSPLPPDLSKVSEEIDHYISSLSSSKGDESIHADVPICVEQFAVLVEAKVEDYDSSDPPVKWSQISVEDSVSFLDAVSRVSKLYTLLREFSYDFKYAYTNNRIGGVLQRAMSYLEEEFKFFVEDYYNKECATTLPQDHSSSEANTSNKDPSRHPVNSSSSSKNLNPAAPESDPPEESSAFPGYPEEIMSNLGRLTNALIEGGYDAECCQVYFVARRSALEEWLQRLGFEKHSFDDIQKMQWEPLTREIESYIKAFKQCMTILLPNERKLSDAVFVDRSSISTIIFNSLSRGILMELLNLAEAIAMTKRAPEKLFKFLDMYEALRDINSALDDLFERECADEIKSEASLIRTRLGEAMITIFCELENSIKADTGKTPVPGGAVHPLTRYIMNYLPYACEYRETLEQVFREHQKIERADSGAGSEFDYNSQGQAQVAQSSPFQIQLIKVMDLLDNFLESKSKLYRDTSLSSIFMMNNGRYILQKIRASPEINNLMGDSWCRKRSSDLRQYHKNYQRETWGKPLNCLMNHEGLNVNGKVVKPVLKERFKSFNAMFDEIHRTQSSWVVCDDQLQSELRVSVSNMVIPAYRAFLARYGQTLTPGRQTEKYVKLQPEDIETYIDELFDGNATTPTGRRKL